MDQQLLHYLQSIFFVILVVVTNCNVITVNFSTMVASKFQPTYARQAFPCFDEPDFKATYDITLVKPVNYVALSNMNVR